MSDAKQELFWLTWVPNSNIPAGGRFNPLPVAVSPKRVWTLYRHTNLDIPPALPFQPVHLQNAFMEDAGHDWAVQPTLQGKMFRFFSRVVGQSIWVLFEY